MQQAKTATAPRWHWIVLGVVGLLAVAIRLYYVHTAMVYHPLRGDTRQYFDYALNLVDHNVFSVVAPGKGTPLPDAFRDPGYPVFLAALLATFGREQLFYLATLNSQAVLSAATVVIYMLLARRWLGFRAAVIVGIGMAFWPHTITMAGLVLSETLLGFLVAAALLCLDVALARKSTIGAIGSGALFALCALTNATVAPAIPLFAAVALWRHPNQRRFWLALLIAALLPLGAWALRGAGIPTDRAAGDRVAMNFVQGSWPEYHRAWYDAIKGDSDAAVVMAQIDAESNVLRTNTTEGLTAVGARLAASPIRYLAWYASKPVELWGWSIGIGDGDIYVFPTYNSPLSANGPLRTTTDALFFLSPLLLLSAAAGLIWIIAVPRQQPQPLVAAATIVMVITLVFTVLQSDTRYATPYRGIEWILAVVGIQAFVTFVRRVRMRRKA